VYIVTNVGIGLILLGSLLAIRQWWAVQSGIGLAQVALLFVPAWLLVTLNTLRPVIVQHAFSLRADGLEFLLIFAVPSTVALIAWRLLRRHGATSMPGITG
jgi:hypothetical protein